jgi:DNA processing protein
MNREELAGWLRLALTYDINKAAARRLLAAFGLPSAIFSQSRAALEHLVGPEGAKAIQGELAGFGEKLEATWQWLCAAEANAPRHVITLADARYPAGALQLADPPLMLYSIGRIPTPWPDAIAIVGSRNPTAQGLANAREFGATFARSGLTVVSGLALGIDGAAHEGALTGAAGTIAVVGTGLDRVYPARHRALAQKIAGEGLLVSEFAIGTPALAENFPIRNRIIAGLAQGTLVVEAAVQSGSLITARLAAEAGRDVFAIPGSIHSPQSRGCHALIKQGAKLVDSAGDIVSELTLPAARRVQAEVGDQSGDAASMPATTSDATSSEGTPSAHEDPVLVALGFDPIGLDELVARTGESAAVLAARLLDFELQGRVARLPGQRFQRTGRG